MVNHKNRKNHRKYKSISSHITYPLYAQTFTYMWLYSMSMDNLIQQKRNEKKNWVKANANA